MVLIYVPILVIALLAAGAFWLLGQTPLITSIPAVQPGTELVILGQHFGSHQGGSTVTLLSEPGAAGQLEVGAPGDS